MQPAAVSYRGATAQIVEACGVGRLPQPPLTGLAELGEVRGVHRTGKHPIDKGAGAMFHARLEEHATRVLGQEPVVCTGTPIKVSKPGGNLPPYVPAAKMADAMASAQLDTLRTVVLYESAGWRTRVMGQLARDYARPELADLPDEQPVVLAPGYKLVTVRLPELVRHGSHDRSLTVGLWTRYHRFAERLGHPRKPAVLAITLVAMRIPLGEDAYWPAFMYSDQGWLPLAQARALHHAGLIGKKGYHLREDYGGPDNVRTYVERALAALGDRYPIIVFAEERERIWPGLCNDRLGEGGVPGQSLMAQGRDVAVVRVGNGQGTPQPSRRTGGGGKLPANPLQPVMPEKILYRHDYGGVVSWLFSG
ncbi:hypothetical protein GCM10009535_57510 [Streptomyces thermocarboxydovorans]|uniref:pPIWI-RE RNaseH domain-containing protein n=1 Tax=Streptomyces thermocarboxydovorans TaxID=59298 RepID=A0ABP3T7U5_9ACTN